MEDNLMTFKAAIAAFCTALGAFLGWQGIMAMVWVLVMLLDYLTGSLAACKRGEWCSAVAREGLWHKAGMIVAVCVAAISDGVLAVICANLPEIHILSWNVNEWGCWLLPLVLAWYIITELGSILENAVKMGALVPEWLVKLLKASLSMVDGAGEGAADINVGDTEHLKPPDTEEVHNE